MGQLMALFAVTQRLASTLYSIESYLYGSISRSMHLDRITPLIKFNEITGQCFKPDVQITPAKIITVGLIRKIRIKHRRRPGWRGDAVQENLDEFSMNMLGSVTIANPIYFVIVQRRAAMPIGRANTGSHVNI